MLSASFLIIFIVFGVSLKEIAISRHDGLLSRVFSLMRFLLKGGQRSGNPCLMERKVKLASGNTVFGNTVSGMRTISGGISTTFTIIL